MKMSRKIVLSVFIMLIMMSLQGFVVFVVQAPIPGNISTFNDSDSYKVVDIQQGQQRILGGELDIPNRAVITNAEFKINTQLTGTGDYPHDVFIDMGDDKEYEWAFIGDGYGSLGQQTQFIGNKTEKRLNFIGDTYNASAVIRLPKNATVTSTTMLIDGRANVSGADSSKPWTKLKSIQGTKVVANITGGNIYFSEYATSWPSNPIYQFDYYNPVTKSWKKTSKCRESIGQYGHAITLAGTEIYLFTLNITATGLARFFKYNTANDTWTDLGAIPLGSWSMEYGGLTYDQGDRIYAMSHTWGTTTTNPFFYYSISNNKWTKIKSPPQCMPNYPTLCYLNGRVYFHDYTSSGTGSGRSLFYYNPNNDTWFRASSAPSDIRSRLETDGYNLFGADLNRQIVKYDVGTGTWVRTGSSSSNFITQMAGFGYSDRQFYLARWSGSGTGDGYYTIPGLSGGDFPLNSTLDIGDNGGVPEWNITGVFDKTDFVSDFSGELNNILSTSSTSYKDVYGNEFVDIVINITSNRTSEFAIRKMFINYTYSEVVDYNPYHGTLVNSLNALVPDTGEGDFKIEIYVYSESKGQVNISDINIDYYIPDLTNDRLELLNGHGTDGKIIFADYMDYTFIVNVSNLEGFADMKSVILYLDVDKENIQLQWLESSNTFSELRDPKDLVRLNTITSSSSTDNVARWTLLFNVRFNWSYADESYELCALRTTNDTDASVFNYFEAVYRVENDLDLIGSLQVTAADQGGLINDNKNNWVHASETITWSNLKVVYEDTVDIYPDDKNFNVTITDDDNGVWLDTSSSGSTIIINTLSDASTDGSDIHHIDITEIPGVGEDVSNWTFEVRVDNDPPTKTSNILCHADYPTDPRIDADDDTEIFVTWGIAQDGSGSGVLEYAMEFNNPSPTQIRDNGANVTGIEGFSTFYVRARDKVGNWGVTGSASIFIDLTSPIFGSASPSPDIWLTNRTIQFSIMINDLEGSGVDFDSIQYRYVDEGNISTASWNKYSGNGSSGEHVQCKQNITFAYDGTEKKVQWRVLDLAGNGRIYSDIYSLKIDSKAPTIKYFSPNLNKWQNTKMPTIKVYINDTAGSGLDISSLKYTVSQTGLYGFGAWLPVNAQVSGNCESALCTVTPNLVEGDNNYIKFQASDLAGNNIEFKAQKIKIDVSGLNFINPIPGPEDWLHGNLVFCRITITDDVSSIDTSSFKYQISTNGTDNYGYWRPISIFKPLSDGRSFNISAKVEFKEGSNNYIRWRATDLAGHIETSNHFRIQIDKKPIEFGIKILEPDEYEWFNELEITCRISVKDFGGSGVKESSIEYSILTSGSSSYSDWTKDDLEITIQNDSTSNDENSNNSDFEEYIDIYIAKTTPKFEIGTENFIRWRGTDNAGNILVVSEPVRVNIDQETVSFRNPQPNDMKVNDEKEIMCMITIEDVGGSGVDPESVEYKYSKSGLDGFSQWSDTGVFMKDKETFFVYLQFSMGSNNYITWRAGDIAGNNITESGIYNLKFNSVPTAKIDSPKKSDKYTSVDKISFSAKSSSDPDFDDVLSYEWSSDIVNVFDDRVSFQQTLPPGTHNITLKVTDQVGHVSMDTVQIMVTQYIPEPDDGDGIIPEKDKKDDTAQNYDWLILIGIIIFIILFLVAFNVLYNRRLQKKNEAEKNKEMVDKKPAVAKSSSHLQSTHIKDGTITTVSTPTTTTQQNVNNFNQNLQLPPAGVPMPMRPTGQIHFRPPKK